MNEQYLWNKTGSDAEIEELETALRQFAYIPQPTPDLMIKTAVGGIHEKRGGSNGLGHRKWFSPLRLVFAAALIAFFGAAAAWLVAFRIVPAETRVASVGQPKPVIEPAFQPSETSSVREEPVLVVAAKPRPIARSHERAKAPAPKRSARPVVQAKEGPVLSSEEIHAYNQLMLALSITGNKLKIVSDAVNGYKDEPSKLPESR